MFVIRKSQWKHIRINFTTYQCPTDSLQMMLFSDNSLSGLMADLPIIELQQTSNVNGITVCSHGVCHGDNASELRFYDQTNSGIYHQI